MNITNNITRYMDKHRIKELKPTSLIKMGIHANGFWVILHDGTVVGHIIADAKNTITKVVFYSETLPKHYKEGVHNLSEKCIGTQFKGE